MPHSSPPPLTYLLHAFILTFHWYINRQNENRVVRLSIKAEIIIYYSNIIVYIQNIQDMHVKGRLRAAPSFVSKMNKWMNGWMEQWMNNYYQDWLTEYQLSSWYELNWYMHNRYRSIAIAVRLHHEPWKPITASCFTLPIHACTCLSSRSMIFI